MNKLWNTSLEKLVKDEEIKTSVSAFFTGKIKFRIEKEYRAFSQLKLTIVKNFGDLVVRAA